MNFLYQELTYKLRGILFEVYNLLGPGLPEKAYHNAIIRELKSNQIHFETEKVIYIKYKEANVAKQRLDLVIDNKIIIEIKATNSMHSLFEKQTLAYLKASNYKLALLVNFRGDRIIINRFIDESVKSA